MKCCYNTRENYRKIKARDVRRVFQCSLNTSRCPFRQLCGSHPHAFLIVRLCLNQLSAWKSLRHKKNDLQIMNSLINVQDKSLLLIGHSNLSFDKHSEFLFSIELDFEFSSKQKRYIHYVN